MARSYHERLDLYVLARHFAIELYRDTLSFPREERFGLVGQIRRSAVSIPANIAEGAARRSKKDFTRSLLTARGSAAELRLLLDIAAEIGNLSRERFAECERVLDRILQMTSGLISRSERAAREASSSGMTGRH
jgi:four helix bundle protein